MKKKNRSLWFAVLYTVFSVFLSLTAQAQTTGSIEGKVINSSGLPIKGLYVDVYDANNPDTWTGWKAGAQTDDNGLYKIENLPACTDCYKVNYYTFNTPYTSEWYDNKPDFAQATKLSVTEGQAATLNDAILTVGGSISGKVTNTSNVPISGVFIYVYQSTFDENGNPVRIWITTDTTDGNGDYKAEGLPVGYSYTIYLGAFDTDYISKWYSGSLYLADTTEKIVNVQLSQGGKISGKVTHYNEKGKLIPVTTAWIDVYDSIPDSKGQPVWRGRDMTDANGLYIVRGLPEGNFKVQFFEKYSNGSKSGATEWYDNKPDFSTATAESVVGTGETANINAELGSNQAAAIMIPIYKQLLLK